MSKLKLKEQEIIPEPPEITIDNKLELIKSLSEVKSSIKSVIKEDFVLAKLGDRDKEAIIEMVANANYGKQLIDTIILTATNWKWNKEKNRWELYQLETKQRTKKNIKKEFIKQHQAIGLLIGTKVWMNPPFSKAKKMFKHFFKIIKRGVAIYRCDNMETKIWQEIIIPNATWIFIPKGRISYEGIKGKRSRFPSALIGYNVKKPKNIEGQTLTK